VCVRVLVSAVVRVAGPQEYNGTLSLSSMHTDMMVGWREHGERSELGSGPCIRVRAVAAVTSEKYRT
jgi:hypothetical protein